MEQSLSQINIGVLRSVRLADALGNVADAC